MVEFYTNNEIIATEALLFESCVETAPRLKTYKVDVAKLNCRDIITKMNEVGANCPLFVAANLAKLPVITADTFNLAKMSKGISFVLNIEQNVDNLKSILKKCTKTDTIAEDLDNLKSAIERRNASQAHGTTSWLDHCITTTSGQSIISHVSVIGNVVCSDHFPLCIKILCDINPL